MLFVLAAALALAAAPVLGGRLSALGEAQVRGLWLLLVAGALKLFDLVAPDSFLPAAWPFLLPVQIVTVALFAVLNLRVPGLVLVLIGCASNLAVVALNGGFMPVSLAIAVSSGGSHEVDVMRAAGHLGTHTLLTPGTRLAWLADTISLPPPLTRAVSPGDLVLAVGTMVALLALARTPTPPLKAVALASFTKLRRFLTAS
jgi:hypothetical protein